MNNTYSKPHRAQHRVDAEPVDRVLEFWNQINTRIISPALSLVRLNWIAFLTLLTPSSHKLLCPGHRIDTTFLNLCGKLPPLCPGQSNWTEAPYQSQKSDPKNGLGKHSKKWSRPFPGLLHQHHWEIARIAHSWAPPQTYWVRISRVGAQQSVFSQVLQVTLMHAQVEKHWSRLAPGRTKLILILSDDYENDAKKSPGIKNPYKTLTLVPSTPPRHSLLTTGVTTYLQLSVFRVLVFHG